MTNDIFSKFGDNSEKGDTYQAFKSATESVAFFSIWGKDNRRLYYAYPSLNFFALSDKSKSIVLEIGKNHILIRGRELKPIAHNLQRKTLDYLRELPQDKKLSEIEADKPVITQIIMMDKFDPDVLLDT